MTHLATKLRLDDGVDANAVQRSLSRHGAVLGFVGQESDKIYRFNDHAWIKSRAVSGMQTRDDTVGAESGETIFPGLSGDLYSAHESALIFYTEKPTKMDALYVVHAPHATRQGIDQNVMQESCHYATVKKSRMVYWMKTPDDHVMRIHVDRVNFNGPEHFVEIEAKLPNAPTPAQLETARAQTEWVQNLLDIQKPKISQSYGRMARNVVSDNIPAEARWLDAVPFDLLQKLNKAEIVSYGPNMTIMTAGSPNKGAYLIRKGNVWVHRDHTNVTRRPGDIVGEAATLNGSNKRCASVIAASNVEALFLPVEMVKELSAIAEVKSDWTTRYIPV